MIDNMAPPEKPRVESKKRYHQPRLTDYGSVARLTMLEKMFKANEGNTKCNPGQAGTNPTCEPIS